MESTKGNVNLLGYVYKMKIIFVRCFLQFIIYNDNTVYAILQQFCIRFSSYILC